ncbi:MAG: transporter, partial [Pseudomonadota bacterium]|nr:transporter [Pseudomonadota bacterium]
HNITGWLSYRWTDTLSNSVRLKYQYSEKIDGLDQNIVLPVQTADPDNYGGEKISLLFGLNWIPAPQYKGLRLSMEGGIPIHQDLNGPQMEEDFVISTGIQYAF